MIRNDVDMLDVVYFSTGILSNLHVYWFKYLCLDIRLCVDRLNEVHIDIYVYIDIGLRMERLY